MGEDNRLWLPSRFGRRALLRSAGATVILAACRNSGSSATATTGGATTTEPTAGIGADPSVVPGTAAPSAMTPGGTLRVGVVGSTDDIVDAHAAPARIDQARLVATWESIANYDTDFDIDLEHSIAEEIDAQAADHYVIRLKDGIEFHNGKTVTADDLIYSFERRLHPDLGLAPALAEFLDPSGVTKVDERTVELRLKQPNITFLNSLAEHTATVVPAGYTREDAEQVGTGPYRLTAFTPGVESVHTRFENYWGTTNLAEVRIIDFADPARLVSALMSGTIDVAIDVPLALAHTVDTDAGFVLLESATGNWHTITMRVDAAPFDDVRVRQAMRLIADREELVERVLSGHGRVANDMYGVLDGSYPDFPQREQDIDAAKALLAEAGRSDLAIELFAPDDTPGVSQLAAVFAEQAREAGVNIRVKVLEGSEYWGQEYTQRVFATSSWSSRPYLKQVAAGSLPTAVYPETHWPPPDSSFEALYAAAVVEVDQRTRDGLIEQMQRIEYEEGGNIIAYFVHMIDAHAPYVRGVEARPNLLPFDHFGRGFKNIWVDP